MKESKERERDEQMEKLYELYEETEKRVYDLEYDYLNVSHLKDKEPAEIFLELWKQAKDGSDIKKELEEILSRHKNVQKIQFGKYGYNFNCLK